jgi:hypothetical protein
MYSLLMQTQQKKVVIKRILMGHFEEFSNIHTVSYFKYFYQCL